MKFKSLIIFSLISTILIGCSEQDINANQETLSPPIQENIIEDNIFDFEFPNYCFNKSFSKDDKGNCYFLVGTNLYKKDSNDKITKFSDRFIKDKYFIEYAYYYENNIYCLTRTFKNKIRQPYRPIIKIDINSKKTTEIIDIFGQGPVERFFVYNNYIYTLHENKSIKYPLNQPSEIEIINENLYRRFSNKNDNFRKYPYNNIYMTEKPFIYFIERIPPELGSSYTNINLIKYNVDNKLEKKIDIGLAEDVRFVDYIGGYFYTWNQDGILKINNEFNEKKLLISKKDILEVYKFTTINGKNKIYKGPLEN